MAERITIAIDQSALVRKQVADEKRAAMASGVVRRAQTFRTTKGKGSYRRRPKHDIKGD